MRGVVEGLGTPYPLAGLVPGVLQEDPFLVRMTAGLDDVLAPVISSLDCLEAYVDPLLAAPDFLEWLAAWVGATLDDNWPESRRRRTVLAAASLHRLRGTVEGIRSVVALATGAEVEVVEPGTTSWTTSPTGYPKSDESTAITVRVYVDQPDAVREAALDELVSLSKPAHLPHVIEVLQR
jgi:phage tail-like protein